jgi:hypothetical protein
MAPGIAYTEPPQAYLGATTEPSGRELVDGDSMGPIAVVGLSLKFPQEATSPEAFWKMLMEKRCAMTEVPSDRLNVDAFQGTDTNRTDQVRVLP